MYKEDPTSVSWSPWDPFSGQWSPGPRTGGGDGKMRWYCDPVCQDRGNYWELNSPKSAAIKEIGSDHNQRDYQTNRENWALYFKNIYPFLTKFFWFSCKQVYLLLLKHYKLFSRKTFQMCTVLINKKLNKVFFLLNESFTWRITFNSQRFIYLVVRQNVPWLLQSPVTTNESFREFHSRHRPLTYHPWPSMLSCQIGLHLSSKLL